MYHKKTIDNFKLNNIGILKNTKQTGVGLVGSPACGDMIQIFLNFKFNKIKKEFFVKKCKIQVFGCVSAFASANYLSKLILNKNINQCLLIKDIKISNSLKLPKHKFHCSVLVEECIKKSILNFAKKNNLTKLIKKINNNIDNSHSFIDVKTENINNQESNNIKDFFIEVSNNAKEYLNLTLNNSGILIKIKKNMCGYEYEISKIKTKLNNSEIIKYENFFICYDINEKSKINNTYIDLLDNGINKQIVLTNRNTTESCKCGKAFLLN